MNKFNLLLEILILTSVICCITVITSTNPVIAIIYLIGVFLNTAIYLILIGLNFIGLSYIIVYIGAITVLFLFVIMMINTDILDIVEIGSEYGKNLPLAYTISIFLFISFILILPNLILNLNNFEFFNTINNTFLTPLNLDNNNSSISIIESNYSNILLNKSLFNNYFNINFFNPEISISNILQIEILGDLLYSKGSILLILTGFILLLALVTPILLSKK